MRKVNQAWAFGDHLERLAVTCEVKVLRHRADELPHSTVIAILEGAVLGREGRRERQVAVGSGFALDVEQAATAALAEGLERWHLLAPPEDTRSCRAPELPEGRVLRADEWPTFTPEQLRLPRFPWRGYHPEQHHTWTRVLRIPSGEPLWVPASLVSNSTAVERFMPSVSSGAAYHVSTARAVLSGLLEVVERDAFTIVWESRSTTPLLNPHAPWQAPEVRLIARELERRGLRFLLRDLTTDLGIPTVLAVVHDPRERRPALALGAATRLSLRAACEKAAREVCHTWAWMCDEHDSRRMTRDETLTRLEVHHDMSLHPYLYGFPQSLPGASHLLTEAGFASGGPPADAPGREGAPEEGLRRLVERLEARGHQVFYKDLSAPVTREPGAGVVKVFVTGLVPLSVGLWGRALGHPRIRDVPPRMNWPHPGPLAPEHGVPHPFP